MRMITDESGKVVGTQDQEPYGEMVSESGERTDRKFASYSRDDGSGMDYAVNRDYQTSIGRYGQPDRIQGSIRNPQTLNRYSYVTNDPINLVDPLGLEGIENDYGIVPVYGGGTGWGGIVGNYIPRYMPMMSLGEEGVGGIDIRQEFKSFLKTMSQDCKDALSGLAGNVLGRLSKLADTAKFYNVDKLGNKRASIYVGKGLGGKMSLGDWFDSVGSEAQTVVKVSRPGIYTRGGESTFANGESGMYFLLHEMTHLAYYDPKKNKNLDQYLGDGLGLVTRAGENWSFAVSRFFNSKCSERR